MPDRILGAKDMAAERTEGPVPPELMFWRQRQNKHSNEKHNGTLDTDVLGRHIKCWGRSGDALKAGSQGRRPDMRAGSYAE